MADETFELNGRATAIGSMPNVDPQEACSLILANLPDIPAWPQLPKRAFTENMYAQFSEGFPGIVLEDDRIWIDRSRDLSDSLEGLYADYLGGVVERGAIGRDYADGLHLFLETAGRQNPKAVKGQITGPISFGLTVTDQDRRPLLYDEVLADALAKHLRLKAAWQQQRLSELCPTTILSVDEPYLSSLGSAYVALPRDQVLTLLDEVLGGISGLKAIHCCGNTDWSVVLETGIDILSFDAYSYGESLTLYPTEVRSFLERGGVIAWGIVPNDEPSLARETEVSLLARLTGLMDLMASKDVSRGILWSRCLITPSCGLESVSAEGAARALELTAKVSAGFKQRNTTQN